MRWREVRPDRLTLVDAKTGPRHVLLGEAARSCWAASPKLGPGNGCSLSSVRTGL